MDHTHGSPKDREGTELLMSGGANVHLDTA